MANMTISVDSALKRDFSKFCSDVGLTASSVLNVCMVTITRERRIPFIIEAPHVPNAETITAMEEGERIAHDPNWPTFDNLDDFWKDLDK